MGQVVIKKELMKGDLEIYMNEIDESIGAILAEELLDEGRRLEKAFNFYDPKSELSYLNNKRKLNISNELLEVIKKALVLAEATSGKYDISKGKAFIARKKGDELPELGCSFRDIEIKGTNISLRHEDALVDLGSIAKGYIVDKLTEFLISRGVIGGCINARGDLRCFGDEEQEIYIEHPREKGKTIGSVLVKNKAVATSGDYKQFVGDFSKSHIVGKKNISSVTVVADDAMTADVCATCLMLVESWERKNFCRKLGISALILDEAGKEEIVGDFKFKRDKKDKLL